MAKQVIPMAWMVAIGVIAGCGVASSLGVTHTAQAGQAGSSGGAPGAVASADGDNQMIRVPDVIGKTPDEARAIARAAGFTTEAELNDHLYCTDGPRVAGRINCQDPDPGKLASRYAMIQFTVHEPATHPGVLVRDQLEALRGMTPDQARQRLKQLGHDGKVTVGVVERFDPTCGQHKVCTTSGDGGISVHDDLELRLNPGLEISAPP